MYVNPLSLFTKLYETKAKGGYIYEQMPQAWVWAHHISILVRLLPDHRNINVL